MRDHPVADAGLCYYIGQTDPDPCVGTGGGGN